MEAADVKMMELGSSLVYNPYYREIGTPSVDLYERFFPGYSELTRVQRSIFYSYVNQRKVIGSRSVAIEVILGGADKGHQPVGKYQTVPATADDIDAAYAVGIGGGCEYEWPYE